MQLADATLPTGGFAHSGGVEAAAQLGLLRRGRLGEPDLANLLQAAAHSHVALNAPFAAAAYELLRNAPIDGASGCEEIQEKLQELDKQLHALLAPNAPACRASELQGRALARLATTLLGIARTDDGSSESKRAAFVARLCRGGSGWPI